MATFNQQNQTVGVQVNAADTKPYKPIICIDFDGVLHSYTSGWQDVNVIPDEPVPGAIEWLNELLASDKVKPVIYSSRSKEARGIVAMKEWLLYHGLDRRYIQAGILEFPDQKPPAFLTIDDRAICFTGVFPTVETMLDFKPWYKQKIEDDVFPPSLKLTLGEFLGMLKDEPKTQRNLLLQALGNRLYTDLRHLEDTLKDTLEVI